MPKRVGIFAGTFDPIHEGHLAFARAALDSGLDKIMFLVEPRPRRKQGVRALEHRIAMAQLAVADKPSYGVIELHQARFTPHETVPVLQQLFHGAQLYLMLGDDVLHHLVAYIAGWPNIGYLADNMIFMVAARGQTASEIKAAMRTLQKTTSSQFRYQIISQKLPAVSSKHLRPALRRGQRPAGVPSKTLDYIRTHRLYSVSEDSK